MKRIVLSALCASVITTTLTANEDQNKDTSAIVPTINIIGTQEDMVKLASSGTIIDKEELETSRVFTVNEALRKVPGLVLRDEEGLGVRPNIGIRGLNPTRSTKVLLLEDGIPLSYAPYGDNASYYFPTIDRFSSIEVLKGPDQIKHGPQTTSGTINFITPDAPEEFGGFVGITAGNRDYLNTKINVGGNGLLLDYTKKQGDGARDNTNTNIDDLNLKLTKRLGDKNTLVLRGNLYNEDSQVSYSGLTKAEYENFGREYNPFNNDSFEVKRLGLSATHDWKISDKALLSTNYYYSYFDRNWWRQSSNTNNIARESNTAAGIVPAIASSADCIAVKNGRLNGLAVDPSTCDGNEGRLRTYTTYGVEPRLTITHDIGELQLGVKAHFEDQDRRQVNGLSATARNGTMTENNQRNTDAYSGFVSNRFDAGEFSITPILRYEHIENKRFNAMPAGASGAGTTGTATTDAWIPGIGLSYNPNESFTMFAGVHKGFAPPRTEDLINGTGGYVDVDPEKSVNYELGFRANPTRGLNMAVTAFHNDFSNLIAVGSIAGGSTPLSQGEATFTGVELSGQYDFDSGFYSTVAYTWLPVAKQDTPFVSVANNTVTGGSKAGNRQPYAPEHTLTAALGYKMGRLNTQVEGVYVDQQYADFAQTMAVSVDGQKGVIPSYTIWNATINYRHEPIKTTFFVTGKNLLDNDYVVDRTRGILTGMPRLVQFGARYDF